MPANTYYPTTEAGCQQLADELAARGLLPTQQQRRFNRDKIEGMIRDILNQQFDWHRSSLQKVILSDAGEVIGGHHRIVVACILGIDLETITPIQPQIYRVPQCFRPVYNWIDVLPPVS